MSERKKSSYFVWEQLPNPVDSSESHVTAELTRGTYTHIYKDHFTSHDGGKYKPEAKFWQVLLQQGWVDLAAKPSSDQQYAASTHQAIFKILGDQWKASLSYPLVLSYRVELQDQDQSKGKRSTEKWILLTPAGFVAIFERARGKIFLKTCYVPNKVACIEICASDFRGPLNQKAVKITRSKLVTTFAPNGGVPKQGFKVMGADLDKHYERGLLSKFRFFHPTSWGLNGKPGAEFPDWGDSPCFRPNPPPGLMEEREEDESGEPERDEPESDDA